MRFNFCFSTRIAKQQETNVRLKSEPILSPSTNKQPQKIPPTKDLTSSLIQSNLNQINLTSPPKSSPMNLKSPDQMWGGSKWNQTATQPVAAAGGWNTQPQQQSNINWNQNNYNGFQQSAAFQTSSQSSNQWSSSSTTTNKAANGLDWNSFLMDNNQKTVKQPLIPSPSSNNANNLLSKDDIMDLLN